jgi:signal transduction histidine kinase/CheY-like chemotaxis protein
MKSSAFAQHLRAAKGTIVERWTEAVHREAVPSAEGLSQPQLLDHVPPLLEEISAALEGAPAPAIEAEGRAHGRHRWGNGYDISEVLREISLLQQTLLDVVEEYAGGSPGLTPVEQLDVIRRLLDLTNRSGHAAVAEFHSESMAARRLLEAELEAANEQKDRFLAMLSHELRNPLSPILAAVQLLEFTESADPRLRRARDVIVRQVRHQSRLIDDLLDVSRVARGKIALRVERHNLKAAVGYAVEACLPVIEGKGQELKLTLPDVALPVDADPVRLEQIVTNLLTNANRYTGPGGTIWLTLLQEGKEAVLRVRDSGIGIAPEQLPRIFDLFVQAETSLYRREGGLGIGLTLVKMLADLHGGTVEAHSEGPGKGAEFVVRLPVAEEAGSIEPSRDGDRGEKPVSRRVALVEDNPDSREVLADLLELLGHQVLTAAHGLEALRLARQEKPEAFVVDLGLPGMDGYEVARALRGMPGGERLLLIALTGHGGPENEERARKAGFDAHLTKPADIDELQRLLATTR